MTQETNHRGSEVSCKMIFPIAVNIIENELTPFKLLFWCVDGSQDTLKTPHKVCFHTNSEISV